VENHLKTGGNKKPPLLIRSGKFCFYLLGAGRTLLANSSDPALRFYVNDFFVKQLETI